MMSAEKLSFDEPIVVTGYGGISPLGLSAQETYDAILARRSGITGLPKDLQNNPYDVYSVARAKGFDADFFTERTGISKKELRKIHLSGQYALAGAAEALQMAGLAEPGSIRLASGVNPDGLGVNIGSGIAGAETMVEINATMQRGRPILPSTTLRTLPDRMGSIVSRKVGAYGPSASMVGACATGNMSIAAALRTLRCGDADIMVAGSFEAQSTKWALAMFDGLTALDRTRNPHLASRPFNDTEKGFVLGEGGGVLVLEMLTSALRRGAKIYAEVAGYAETNDASDDDTMLDGVGSAKALRRAVEMSGDFNLAYVNAHATGTAGDKIEIGKVIADVLSPDQVAGVSSTKGATGHMVGGAGAAEAIISIQALNSGYLPPTLKLGNPVDEAEGWNLIPYAPLYAPNVDIVFNNSFGFGGVNSVVAFRKFSKY